MPTYEYACRDCAHELEVVQSFSDDPLTVCPVCGGTLRKRFSAAGIIFKGSGYYVTDSRAKPATAAAGGAEKPSGDGSAASGGDSGSGTSSEGSSSAGSSSGGSSSGKSSGGGTPASSSGGSGAGSTGGGRASPGS